MGRLKKNEEWEKKYEDKVAFLSELYKERAEFLATFRLPGYEDDDEESSKDSSGGGSGGSGNANIGTKYDDIINKAGKKFGINPFFIASIIKQESNFNPTAGSHAGARGLMQLMPGTASGLGVKDVTDPEDNVMGGTKYIKQMLEAEKWDPVLALAAYNAGPGNVSKYGGVPPFKETQDYVKKIPNNFKEYTGEKLTKDNVRWNGDELSGEAGGSGDAKGIIATAKSWLNKSNRYVFGGGRSQSDIKAGKFDCSSFVHYCFKQNGIDLGELTGTSTNTLIKKGKKVSTKDLKPGDLVFFDSYKIYGHVTIYMGNNKCIGSQSSSGVAVFDMQTNTYWKKIISNQHRRIL